MADDKTHSVGTEIELPRLRESILRLLDHLEHHDGSRVVLDADWYWDIEPTSGPAFGADPPSPTIGSYLDALKAAMEPLEEPDEPPSFPQSSLIAAGDLLRALGYRGL
jgi:hypothetical protein